MLQTNNETYAFTDNPCNYCSNDCSAAQYLKHDIAILDFEKLHICYGGNDIKSYLQHRKETLTVCLVPCRRSAISLIESCGYYLISTQSTFYYDYTTELDELPVYDSDYTIFSKDSYNVQSQKVRLQEFAYELASLSYYGKDENLSIEHVQKLYEYKIATAIEDPTTHIFWAVDFVGALSGFILLSEKHNYIQIEVLAVHQSIRRKGIAQELVKYACLYAKECEKDLIVHLQAENSTSIRLYQKASFLQKNFSLIYHKVRI